MNQCVWACNISNNNNFGWYEPWFGPDVPEADRLKRSGRIGTLNLGGAALPVEEYPQQTLATRGTPKGGKNIVTCENRNILVSDKLADLLSEFDLGEGGFAPSKIVKRNKSREIHELGFQLNYWRWRCTKKTLMPKQSVGVTQFFNAANGITPESGIEIWNTPAYWDIKDNDLAFSPEALEGPDVWVEKGMIIDVFLSDRLAQTLKKKRLHKPFDMRACRIVEP